MNLRESGFGAFHPCTAPSEQRARVASIAEFKAQGLLKQPFYTGDTVGLLFNVQERSMTAYCNNVFQFCAKDLPADKPWFIIAYVYRPDDCIGVLPIRVPRSTS